jgi:hypothetical protein
LWGLQIFSWLAALPYKVRSTAVPSGGSRGRERRRCPGALDGTYRFDPGWESRNSGFYTTVSHSMTTDYSPHVETNMFNGIEYQK